MCRFLLLVLLPWAALAAPEPPATRAAWDEGHDFVMLGEEAFLEPPGEFEFIFRGGVEAPSSHEGRATGDGALSLEVETGLAKAWELELEVAGRALRYGPEDAAALAVGVTELEVAVRYAPIHTRDRVWAIGLGALAPTGGARAGVQSHDGPGLVAHTSWSEDMGWGTLHLGTFAELLLTPSRPRGADGEVLIDEAGARLSEARGYEVELYTALALPNADRTFWALLEYQAEVEPEHEPSGEVEAELEHTLAVAGQWMILLEEGDGEIEPLKIGGGPMVTYAEDRLGWGGRLQVQFEVE